MDSLQPHHRLRLVNHLNLSSGEAPLDGKIFRERWRLPGFSLNNSGCVPSPCAIGWLGFWKMMDNLFCYGGIRIYLS